MAYITPSSGAKFFTNTPHPAMLRGGRALRGRYIRTRRGMQWLGQDDSTPPGFAPPPPPAIDPNTGMPVSSTPPASVANPMPVSAPSIDLALAAGLSATPLAPLAVPALSEGNAISTGGAAAASIPSAGGAPQNIGTPASVGLPVGTVLTYTAQISLQGLGLSSMQSLVSQVSQALAQKWGINVTNTSLPPALLDFAGITVLKSSLTQSGAKISLVVQLQNSYGKMQDVQGIIDHEMLSAFGANSVISSSIVAANGLTPGGPGFVSEYWPYLLAGGAGLLLLARVW